ncbi:16S rRNA (guanine(527)-N(7))-methyltransferase RsmG [Candidatus Phytoplasma solani]|uniref:Ribosomal RNA small subunit methyltransferase G n=1 Tax=Candidatus Phytoplasma solani TaxID=69896 RepID=A0A421NYR8_9MOLU|nr:16S rRNA (guanine(527)-N(7))-methyltransferase RsmG [Candidatus Phytoplasma solani]RMI89156.1 16S rRNA (guanine527-N7)-methyltransferase [Candidatus Phytoplasma solani]
MPHSKLLKNKFNLSQKQTEQFDLYYQFLTQENQKYNLTSLISLTDVYYKHFYDSLILQEVLDFRHINTLGDVGAGAGFPSFPLKIIYPHLKIYIIESSLKKINFLKALAKILSLDDIYFFHQRVQNHHKHYDCIVARALGNLSRILQWCLPLVKKRSYFIAMKGKNFNQELKDSQTVIKEFKITLIKIQQLELPMQLGTRANLLFQAN